MGISAPDSFRMAAMDLDTTKPFVPTPVVKDTILILSGKWSLVNAPDSIILKCSYCRVIDTAQKILYDRPVETERVPLPAGIDKSDEGIISWNVSFSDLAPLIPLLGLTIPESAKGMLSQVEIQLQKVAQE
jgi:hypothetical protein